MISGSASVEALIPGNAGTITRALETTGAGVWASRQIAQAWEMVSVPSWKGQAAAGWASFVPRETGRVGLAPAAFNRAATALMRYEAAFVGARAQAQAAIEQARAAEQASANARQEHRTAVSTAALADPGTAAAVVPAFRDPGRAGLASAQAQLDTARQNLQRQGDEAAAEIRSASMAVSEVAPGVMAPPGYNPNIDTIRGTEFLKGILFQAGETLLGLLQLSIVPLQMYLQFEQFKYLFDGPEAWAKHDEEVKRRWADGTNWRALANAYLAWDLWETNPYQAAGRVTFEVLATVIPVLNLAKLGKAGSASRVSNGIGDVRGGAPVSSSVGPVRPSNVPNISRDISEGHAFEKHVIRRNEFPGVTTKQDFGVIISDVIRTGEARQLGNGRTAFWKDGVIVLLDPRNPDGGTAFRPTGGYGYFIRIK